MHFIFNRENHRADLRFSFDDLTNTFGAQLEAFGHTWEINDNTVGLTPDTVNVLFEGFSDEAIEVYGRLVPHGARYICIATEQPTGYDADGRGGEFNFGQPAHMHGRQARFVEACARLRFLAVWALVGGDDTLAWYRRWCSRVAHLPIGFAPRQLKTPAREPEFEFGMYGSILRGGRRWQWLERLHQATGHAVHVLGANGIVPVEDRDREMQRCKVLLQIRPNDRSELVSSSRLAASLHAGRCVVAEHHRLHEPYGRIVRFAREPGFKSFLSACQLALATWRTEYALQLGRFREILSPEATMLPALEAAGIGRATPGRAPAGGRTVIAAAVWGDDIPAWLRCVLPRLAGAPPAAAPRVRIYSTDVDVQRLTAEPAIQELGRTHDVELRGLAPSAADGLFAESFATATARLQHLASVEAARAGETLIFLLGDTMTAAAA